MKSLHALFVVLLTVVLLTPTLAQQRKVDSRQEVIDPVSIIDDRLSNSIKVLKNRFRVDYKAQEITLLFFRNFGSAPVILVQPNGTKLYQNRSETNPNIEWYDDLSYDMIKIKQPMPGPWQVIGDVLPQSRVMVLSELELLVEPLPSILFAGEILKKTVRLENNGQPIDQNEFRDVVALDVRFNSTNNESAQNFALPSVHITQFQDNGKGMDERPNDGVFTGKFNLAISSGEWEPVFDIVTPMFSRQYRHDFVNLLPSPVAMGVDLDKTSDGSGEHTLYIYADSPFILQQDFVITGNVQSPNGDLQNFSVTDVDESGARNVVIPNYLSGVYRVNSTLYATTIDEREIVLTVPEYSFVVEERVSVEDDTNSSVGQIDKNNAVSSSTTGNSNPSESSIDNIDNSVELSLRPAPAASEKADEFPWLTLFFVNLIVFILGGGLIIWFWLRK